MRKNISSLVWFKSFIVIVLLIGIYFRFTNLDGKVYWNDEVHTSSRVSGYNRTEFVNLAPTEIVNFQELQKFQSLTPERDFVISIKALASSEHSPLYYILARIWMELFGDSIIVTRGLAAIISLFAFPCIYWLSIELFASSLIGELSMALLAVSPFHLLYAQEAREYSLLSVTILLSSAAFLWACKSEDKANRNSSKGRWFIYAVTVALTLYTHPLGGLVIFGFGVYLLVVEKFRFTKKLINYIVASLGGLFAFSPWIYVFIVNGDGIGGWVARDISLMTLFQRWWLNLCSIFFDLQVGYQDNLFNIETGMDMALGWTNPVVYLGIIVAILVVFSIFLFCCQATNNSNWFIWISLIGITALVLGLPDIISGGQRSTVGRYIIAIYLAIELMVAYTLAYLINSFWGRGMAAFLISLGIICCFNITQADTWWNKYSSFYNHEVAAIINQASQPLVISNSQRISRSTSLSYLVNPDVKLLLMEEDLPTIKIPEGFGEVFVFRPYQDLIDVIKENNYKITKIHNLGHLWRVEK